MVILLIFQVMPDMLWSVLTVFVIELSVLHCRQHQQELGITLNLYIMTFGHWLVIVVLEVIHVHHLHLHQLSQKPLQQPQPLQ